MLHLPPLKIFMPGAAGGYIIEGSALFGGTTSDYLSWTPSGAGDSTTTGTLEMVVKFADVSTRQALFNVNGSGIDWYQEWYNTNEGFRGNLVYSAANHERIGAGKLRDPSGWMQIITKFNTGSDEIEIYINGTLISYSTKDAIATNSAIVIGSAVAHYIGSYETTNFPGKFYLARCTYIDGQALDPTSFGQLTTDAYWEILDVSGLSFGTNGFLLEGGTNIAAGTDSSGNGNDFTPSGSIVSTADSPTDSATDGYGNHMQFDPNAPGAATLSNGNRSYSTGSANSATSNFNINTGKIYLEFEASASGVNFVFGLSTDNGSRITNVAPAVFRIRDDGTVDSPQCTVDTDTFSGASTGDIFGIEIDFDAETVAIYQNTDPSVGSPVIELSAFTSTGPYFFQADRLSSTPSVVNTIHVTADSWTYTPNNGYLAWATQNITSPAASVNPSDHASVVLYEGNGSTQSITGAGFQPDLVVIKNRDAADSWVWTDAVRGVGEILSSDSTAAEATDADTITAFGADGFSLGADVKVNTSSESYMALCLKAGGAGSTNSDGSITATVSANQTSGFSIVKFTGDGNSAATLGHGLPGVSMTITKCLDTNTNNNNWLIWHKDLGTASTQHLYFSTSAVNDASATSFGGGWYYDSGTGLLKPQAGTSNADTPNENTKNYVIYCFADVADLATSIFRIGSYTGNTNADGPMITQDASILGSILKRTNTAGYDWYWYDSVREPTNPVTAELNPNTAEAEAQDSSDGIDYLSNGMKNRAASNYHNNGTIIYMHIIDKFLAGGSDAWTQGRGR